MDEHERKLWNDYVKLLASEINCWRLVKYEVGVRYRERLGLDENNERQFTVTHTAQSTVV